jgi:hypothetical protein
MKDRQRAEGRRQHAPGRRSFHAPAAVYLLPVVLLLASCGPKVDLKQALRLTDVSTGWFDAGIVEGKNKLVPSVTFRLEKPGDVKLQTLSLNVAFKRLNGQEEEEQDEIFLQKVEFTEGSRTSPLTIRAEHGYTGDPPQSRADMLRNSQFRDYRAIVFAKQGSGQWVQMAKLDIQRQLLLK